jgi:hypothetical protein
VLATALCLYGEALSSVIQLVLSWDNEKKKKAAERARDRAAQFFWDITAEKTVEEFEMVF